MRLFTRIISIGLLLSVCISFNSCNSSKNKHSNIHEVVVKEVLQAGDYTYLNVTEGDSTRWIAAPAIEAVTGKTYYYKGGSLIKNFKSKELNRTFDAVVLIENLSAEPIPEKENNGAGSDSGALKKPGKPVLTKKDMKIEPAKGGISIEELYKNKANYSGKTVKVRGVVTKLNEGIMDKNWIHLQDGTDYKGDFDLTATSADLTATVGDTITLEGKIALDKDFGYNYFYKVLMENTVKK